MKKSMTYILVFMFVINTISYQTTSSTISDIIQPVNPYTLNTTNEDIISMIEQLDETMVLQYIENLTSFGPRVTSSQACTDAGTYIYTEFKKMGLEVYYQNWSSHSYSGSNIEGTLRGLNSSSSEIYLICGHYDSVSSSPGADDNGAGTTAVLTAATILSQHTFNHTIKFVAFSGEEQGLFGSKAYAEEAAQNNDNIIVAINMDMMGYAEENDDKVRLYYNEYFEWIMDFSINVNQQYIEYIDIEAIPSGSTGRSDHVSFWNEEYNAIFFSEYDVNPYYHSPGDTIEHMSIPYTTQVCKLSMAILAELSEPSKNLPPITPQIPEGPMNGKPKTTLTYSTKTTDSHNHKIFYLWDWGDGNITEWIGPYNSNEICSIPHSWNDRGSYQVRVKAKDEHGLECDWSDPYHVEMPKVFHLSDISQLYRDSIQRFILICGINNHLTKL